jgi:hypothetical protein
MFKSKKFKPASQVLIAQCTQVIDSYKAQGFRMTLRQLYYQLVSKNIIPNSEKSYKSLGKLVSDGRLAGRLDWDIIEDRVRVPKRPNQYKSLSDLVEAAVYSYRLPRMDAQDEYVELWVEKDALAGVLAPIASRYHSVLMVNRGYSSQSAMMEAAQRIDRACRNENGEPYRDATILYLGDLDPSGEDMVRDIDDRLAMFLDGGYDIDYAKRQKEHGSDDLARLVSPSGHPLKRGEYTVPVHVEKLALTIEQVNEYQPPPNPTKLSDTRAKDFIAKYGHTSWEVDALPPNVLTQIIETRFEELLDMEAMQIIKEQEAQDIAFLREVVGDRMSNR